MEYLELNVKNYPDFLRLYNESFPENERRPFDDAQHLDEYIKMKGGKFHVLAAEDGHEFVGFLSYWIFKGFVYIEHFAVSPEKRGRNIGRTMLHHILSTVGENVLVEVELPETDEAKRRIKFYEQAGFRVRREINYTQPPYAPHLNKVPMLLMTHGDVDLKDFKKTLEPMLREVYNYNSDQI